MTAFRFTPTLACSVIATFALALSLGGCKPAGQQEPAATADAPSQQAAKRTTAMTTTRWRCGELAVSTHFDDDSLESITVQTPERTLTLKSMLNEDGVRFADAAGNEFWSRPGKVSLTQVGQTTVECTKDRGEHETTSMAAPAADAGR